MFALRRMRYLPKDHLKFRFASAADTFKDENRVDESIEDLLKSDSEYSRLADSFIQIGEAHSCYIIQPYVKWGPKKLTITPEEQLQEAEALIKTLPHWKVQDTCTLPLESLEKKALFGSGNLEKLSRRIRGNPNITSVFVNKSSLKRVTTTILTEHFRVPILDRYEVVIQILKMHATSEHAKLQVALAELYYIQRKAQQNRVIVTHDPESLKLIFQDRETKLKAAIQQLRSQRSLLRNKRKKLEYPVIAVVGYTNCGKTSLIKALTGEKSLQPRNQLFATLDVTVHKGILPSGLEVLYVDTVGFLSDLPTNLLECFIATLEDAVLADLVLHVEDLASSCFEYNRKHVNNTLKDLGAELGAKELMEKVFSVGNKCDCVPASKASDILAISATEGTGLDELRLRLEEIVLKVTDRQKITIKIPNGGDEIRWLYKNATILSAVVDEKDPQCVGVKVIITKGNLGKFKHLFI